MEWHSRSTEEILKEFGTDIACGLTSQEAKERAAAYGPNKLNEKPPRTFCQRFIEQMKDAMVVILLVAAAVSLGISTYHASTGQEADWSEPAVIIGIVVLNAFLGVIQESKAEAALEALKKMSMPHVRVRRDGGTQVLDSAGIVPGDVLLLEAGDIVPADARVIESAALKSDDSSLTGESVPSEKEADAIAAADAPLGDRVNMLYSGCAISYGRATAVVTETGMRTEMGKIALMLENESDADTPLQQKLAQLGKYLGLLALAICAVIFGIGIFDNLPLMEMFMTAVSLAVAAIPEGLPAIVTIVLAIGVQRMVAKHAIIRRLPAVETFGSTSVICSDKTGTLTQNRMTILKLFDGKTIMAPDRSATPQALELIKLATLCTDATVTIEAGQEKHIGDPTESAIVAAALCLDMEKEALEKEYPRLAELPFDSDRKLMTTVHQIGSKVLAVVKGAPDILLACCTSGNVQEALEANEAMSGEALRVLAVAFKELPEVPERPACAEIENGLTLLGLVGMIDPPREEVFASIKECRDAGIRTVMITGDHVTTAAAIASQLGILGEGQEVITGAKLAAMTDEALGEKIDRYRVYARVTPADKIRIVKAWQKNGQIAAMTGDGVNDAPALKAADIGCAMGVTGTKVAKGAADMILTDDNFATIVSAVREERGIYDNIRKAIQFLLSCNLGEILTVFCAMMFWRESPLLPIQLLWINLVTDSMPALALGMEPIEFDVMRRRPRAKNESVFANGVGVACGLQGIIIGTLTLIAYYIGTRGGLPNGGIPLGETMAFAVLAISQLVHAFNVRSTHSLFKVGFISNKYMVAAFFASLALMLVVLFVPALQRVFKVITMNADEWSVVIGLTVLPFVFCKIGKLLHRTLKSS